MVGGQVIDLRVDNTVDWTSITGVDCEGCDTRNVWAYNYNLSETVSQPDPKFIEEDYSGVKVSGTPLRDDFCNPDIPEDCVVGLQFLNIEK